MSSWLLEEKNTLQPHQAALLQEQGGARDAFPKPHNWQAPVLLTERIHLDTNSSAACWHNITAVFPSSKSHLIFAQTFQGRAVLFLPLGQDTFPRHSLKS